MQTETTTTTDAAGATSPADGTTSPAPKPDAQPVQVVSFTPGPWQSRHLCVTREGNYVADCDVSYIFSHEEKQANVRLIAAAPDLLAALEQCLPYVDRVRAMSGGDGDLTALTARAALAAAKGGAQ
jgi:hypothetical protein